MSILIRGMEMPKSCDKCELMTANYGCAFVGAVGGESYRKRAWDCPLVEVPEPMKWIPVTERLPKNHQHCLVFTDTHRMGYFAKNLEKVDKYDFQGEKHHGWYYLDSEWGYCEIRNVTHWMPLPQPPEDGET